MNCQCRLGSMHFKIRENISDYYRRVEGMYFGGDNGRRDFGSHVRRADYMYSKRDYGGLGNCSHRLDGVCFELLKEI